MGTRNMHHWTWNHSWRPPGWFLSPSIPLLPRQLLTVFGDTVISFSLSTCAGHRWPEVVIYVERCLFEFATVVSRLVAGNRSLQWSILLLNQPDVAVKAYPHGRPRATKMVEDCALLLSLSCMLTPQKGAIPCIWGPFCWVLLDMSWPSVESTQFKDMPCNTGGTVLNLGWVSNVPSSSTSALVYLSCNRCCRCSSTSCRLKG